MPSSVLHVTLSGSHCSTQGIKISSEPALAATRCSTLKLYPVHVQLQPSVWSAALTCLTCTSTRQVQRWQLYVRDKQLACLSGSGSCVSRQPACFVGGASCVRRQPGCLSGSKLCVSRQPAHSSGSGCCVSRQLACQTGSWLS